jgi:hypothetical protein
MRINIMNYGKVQGCLLNYAICDVEKDRSDAATPRTCEIEMVEIRRVRTDQLHLKANQPPLAARLFKLWP